MSLTFQRTEPGLPNTLRLDLRGISFTLEVRQGVFVPSPTSFFLLANMSILPGQAVLDVCTGTGLLAIAAAKLGARSVIATDRSTAAIELAHENARINGCRNVEVRCADAASSCYGQYDVVVANPPQLPLSSRTSSFEWLWGTDGSGGELGDEVVRAIVERIPDVLAPGGCAYIPVASLSNPASTIALMDRIGNRRLVARQDLPFTIQCYAEMDHLISMRRRGLAEFAESAGVCYFREEIFELRTE